tara:strand:- start:1469 stop:2374 length:906 start_codon:yes stop_codon:yes gene_type:complete
MKTKDQEFTKIIKLLSGGDGSDHFSPSQLNLPIPKWMINYLCCTQQMRRKSIANYKMHFGNLTNNTAQRMLAKYLFVGDKKIEIKNRDRQDIFGDELDKITNQEIRDEKDKWSREAMVDFAKPCIDQTLKAVKEIFGTQPLQSERYVSHNPKDLFIDILGRIDYESMDKLAEMKSKPPYVRTGKKGYSISTQKLPEHPDDNHISQVAFYYCATKKKPYLFYVNDNGYVIFDNTHEKLQLDYLEYVYEKMVNKAKTIQRLLLISEGKAEEMAKYVEPPDTNHPYYYKDLTEEQQAITKQLWG